MLVRLKKGKKTYEVLVNEGMVNKYRDGSLTKVSDVVITPVVFLNSTKGDKASSEQLKSVFDTDDVNNVIDIILRTGEAQESAGERKDKMDAKRHEIITYIQKNYVTPEGQTLPLVRIENGLNKVRPRIDVDVDAGRQATAMFDKLREAMPMKKKSGEMEGTITIPMKHIGAVNSVVRKHASVLRETYGAQVKLDVDIFAYDLLMKDLAKATKGEFEFKVATPVGQPDQHVGEPANATGNAQGGRKKKKKKGKK